MTTKREGKANGYLPTLAQAKERAKGWGDCSDEGFVEAYVLLQENIRLTYEATKANAALREALEDSARVLSIWQRDAEEMHRIAPGKGHDVTAEAYRIQVLVARRALGRE